MALVFRDISATADTGRGIRLAVIGVLAGTGIVGITTTLLDWLYRNRPRLWLAIAPSPITVLIVVALVFYGVVNPVGTSLGSGYILGALLWLQWEWSSFSRQEEEDLHRLLRDPESED